MGGPVTESLDNPLTFHEPERKASFSLYVSNLGLGNVRSR